MLNCATFAFKYNNGVLNGTALAADGTGAEDLIATMMPTADNIQGSAAMTDTTDAGGAFGWSGLMEGPYTVSLTGDATWEVVTSDISVDIEGNGDVDIANFVVRLLDTSIKGVVVNDRDGDGNVIDPNEGLAGVVINVYADGDSTATIDADSLAGTATTDANGAYTVSGLPENTYIVEAVQPAGFDVFRAITSSGVLTDTSVVMTGAMVGTVGDNLTREVGSTLPTPLPAFAPGTNTVSFDGRTNFTFVTNDNEANGVIMDGAGAPVALASVVLTRCQTSAGFTATPIGPPAHATGLCTTVTTITPTTANTDAAGAFSFTGLQEGVYQVVPSAASTPTAYLFWLSGPTDVDKGDFTQP